MISCLFSLSENVIETNHRRATFEWIYDASVSPLTTLDNGHLLRAEAQYKLNTAQRSSYQSAQTVGGFKVVRWKSCRRSAERVAPIRPLRKNDSSPVVLADVSCHVQSFLVSLCLCKYNWVDSTFSPETLSKVSSETFLWNDIGVHKKKKALCFDNIHHLLRSLSESKSGCSIRPHRESAWIYGGAMEACWNTQKFSPRAVLGHITIWIHYLFKVFLFVRNQSLWSSYRTFPEKKYFKYFFRDKRVKIMWHTKRKADVWDGEEKLQSTAPRISRWVWG